MSRPPAARPSMLPWLVIMAAGTLVMLGGLVDLPLLSAAARWTSLADLPAGARDQFGYLLTIPVGALVVVFVRVTLGLRVLGPFRPILIAVALQFTGTLTGLGFLAATFLLMIVLRPALERQRLPYFSRVALSLSAVALFTMVVIVVGHRLEITVLQAVAHFPIVVLCLAAESFARTAASEGARSALWRGAVTAVAALAINLVVLWPGVTQFLLAHPALLLVQLGGIALMTRTLGFRALEGLNPKPAMPVNGPAGRKRAAKSGRKSAKKIRPRGDVRPEQQTTNTTTRAIKEYLS